MLKEAEEGARLSLFLFSPWATEGDLRPASDEDEGGRAMPAEVGFLASAIALALSLH